MKNDALKQGKVRTWLGGLQVQLSITNSHYFVYINMMFMGMMFWTTTAAPNIRPYIPWASFWMFALLLFIVIMTVMLLDYKYQQPSRQGYLNKQAAKHDNPIYDDIKLIQKNVKANGEDIKAIKKALGVK